MQLCKKFRFPPTTTRKGLESLAECLCLNECVYRMWPIGQHETRSEADYVVSGCQLRHANKVVFNSVSGAVVAPSCRPWWMRIGDSGGERQSPHSPLSAAWFSARPRTEKVSLQSHPGEILFPWKTRKWYGQIGNWVRVWYGKLSYNRKTKKEKQIFTGKKFFISCFMTL